MKKYINIKSSFFILIFCFLLYSCQNTYQKQQESKEAIEYINSCNKILVKTMQKMKSCWTPTGQRTELITGACEMMNYPVPKITDSEISNLIDSYRAALYAFKNLSESFPTNMDVFNNCLEGFFSGCDLIFKLDFKAYSKLMNKMEQKQKNSMEYLQKLAQAFDDFDKVCIRCGLKNKIQYQY